MTASILVSLPVAAMRPRQIRLVAGCTVGLATGFAGLFIGPLTIFMKPIAQDFSWTRADISAGVVVSMLGLAIGSPLQGRLMDRIGARPVIAGSTVLFATCIALLSIIPANHTLFALICLAIGTFGVATGPNGYLSLLPAWFDKRLGLALACAMVGVGVGAAAIAPLSQWQINVGGWRHAYRILAALALAGGLLAFFLTHVGVRSPSTGEQAPGNEQAQAIGTGFVEGLRDWRMIILIAALAIGGASGLSMTFHTAPMLDDRGFGPGEIATTVALSGIGVMTGRFAGGALMDFIPARFVGAGSYLLGALAVALLGLDVSRSFPVVATGGLLLGFALGTEGDFAAFAVRRYFGTRSFAGLYGCVFTSYSIGSVIGVILCGVAYDTFHNYHVASVVCIISFLTAAMLALQLGPYRYGLGQGADIDQS